MLAERPEPRGRGGAGSQLQGFSQTPSPLVTRLGSGSGVRSLCTLSAAGSAPTASQTKGPGLRAYYRVTSEAWSDPFASRSALGLWSTPGLPWASEYSSRIATQALLTPRTPPRWPWGS